MRKLSWLIVSAVGALLVAGLLASCGGQVPTADIDAAKAAVAKADGDGNTQNYAPDFLAAAKDSLTKTLAAVDAKKYADAKALAQATVQAANKAIADGQTGAAKAKDTATALMGTLKASITEVENALAGAKKTRGIKLDFTALTKDLNAAKDQVSAAQTDVSGNNYKSAIQKGEAARSSLADLLNRIAEGVRAASRKK